MREKFTRNKDTGEYDYALEHDFKALTLNYDRPASNKNFMILPVIYGEEYDTTDHIIHWLLCDWLKNITRNHFIRNRKTRSQSMLGARPLTSLDEWGWIRGYFYKQEKFKEKEEWRLVTPIKGEAKPKILGVSSDNDFSKAYVSPKSIYYSLNISDHNFEMLDKIVVSKGLVRYKMIKNENTGTLSPERIID